MKLIERTSYLRRLINVMHTPDIKVITGIRRCGKSKLMDAFIDHIEKLSGNNNIVRVQLNLKPHEKLKDSNALFYYIDARYDPQNENLLFIVMVQLFRAIENVIISIT